jgi:hypothetical protein
MPSSLPRHPNLGHLKKQAKMLLAAQRRGVPASCALLRRIRRYSELTDEELLASTFSLADAQLAISIHYGFPSWKDLVDEVRSHPPSSEYSLDAVREGSEEPIPDYAGAGVPLAVVAGLNHASIPIRFMEFVAASGWAFSFGYLYDDISPAYMAVRGRPGSDGPTEVFSFLPVKYGLGYEMALTSEPDEVWSFVREHVDQAVPVMSEHMDGGLMTAWREKKGKRQILFDGTVTPGWIDVDRLNPYAVYSFVNTGNPCPQEDITLEALKRAVAKGVGHEWHGVPQGMDALRSYLTDVQDPEKHFAETAEWFCWATFERLLARRCAEVWLRSVAARLDGAVAHRVAAAAGLYGEAFQWYDRYLGETQGCNPPRPTLWERARSPDRIATIVPLLENGIAAEAKGLEVLAEANELLASG